MSHVALFANGAVEGGKTILMPDSMKDLLNIASRKFDFEVKCVYNSLGEEIKDHTSLINGQLLYVSKGEPFIILDKSAFVGINESDNDGEWIRLNVGGTYFTTTRTTLLKEPESMLAKMFDTDLGMGPGKLDGTGAYLIDRDPTYFKPILNYLRDGKLALESHTSRDILLNEANFFGLQSLASELENHFAKHFKEITRADIASLILVVPVDSRPKLTLLKYINLTGCDLSSFNLRLLNFKGTSFCYCNMMEASFYNCCLENADFQNADARECNFMGSNMRGVNLTAANLQFSNFSNCIMEDATICSANLQNCTFEETKLAKANLKKSNLRSSTMESSDLEKVVLVDANIGICTIIDCDFVRANLRGANLTESVIRNCNLYCADLSGADLRSSVWSGKHGKTSSGYRRSNGSNLSEANLSGANLQGLNLMHWNLHGADLSGADMRNCDLTACYLTESELRDTSARSCPENTCILRNAVLAGANLQDCKLNFSYLLGASLKGAILQDVTIEDDRLEMLLKMAE